MKINFKSTLPHIVAVAIFLIFSCIYFAPAFGDYTLNQGDITQYRGMEKEISDFRMANDGEEPLWTNAMFGGMPAYQISVAYTSNLFGYVNKFLKLGLPGPVGLLFIAMLGFYIFALCLRVKPWLGILGAVAFGFSTINILYIGAGHVTKVNAIAYMAPTLGGLILAFRGKCLLGSAIFAFFLALNITANHLQMTYYLMFLAGLVALSETIHLIVKQEFKLIAKVGLALSVGAILAVLPSIGSLTSTNEYGAYTTRGATNLTLKAPGEENKKAVTDGLETNYILEYNYGKREILSILSPSAKGEKGGYIGNDEAAMENVDAQYAQQVAQMSHYWGGQRMSGGAFYFGVIMLVFFIFGLIFVKDTLKWPFVVMTITAILLASNDPSGINDYFINNFPLYNKFRDSKMILVLLQVMIPAMGILFVDKLLKKEGLINTKKELLIVLSGFVTIITLTISVTFALFPIGVLIGAIFFYKNEGVFEKKKAWLITGGIISLVVILFYAVPSLSGDFITKEEAKMFADATKGNNDPNQLTFVSGVKSSLYETRVDIYKRDLGRSILLVFVACGLILVSVYTKITSLVWTIVAFVFVTGDNISVAKRYLNNEGLDESNLSWMDSSNGFAPYLPSTADNQILANEKSAVPSFNAKVNVLKTEMLDHPYYENLNTDLVSSLAQFGVLNLNTDYRVLSLANTFNETNTSYFHKSLGGYHGAKLKSYQEVISFALSSEMQQIGQEISAEKNKKLQQYAVELKLPQESAQAVFDTIAVSSLDLSSTPVINMLNTKYVILDKSKGAIKNTNANGNVWFVTTIKKVNSANEEMKSLSNFDSKNTAIVDVSANSDLKIKSNYTVQESDHIKLTKYGTNSLKYTSNSSQELPAIFSEIYYPAGWNCYIDDKQVDVFRANYILRGAMIPAGKHEIEWRFEPRGYNASKIWSLIGSGFIIVVFFGLFLLQIFILNKVKIRA